MDYIALGKRIRRLRQQMRWTQEMLADKTGVSISFLGHIERGSRKASLETLVSLCNALGVSSDSILCDSLNFSSEALSDGRLNDKQRRVLKEVVRVISDSVDVWADN